MIFANTIILGEGLGWAVTDEMTLKHASLQLSLHPSTKAPACPSLKKENTDSFLKRGNTRCTSLSRDMVGRSGRPKTQRMTRWGCVNGIIQQYTIAIPLRWGDVWLFYKEPFTVSKIVIFQPKYFFLLL